MILNGCCYWRYHCRSNFVSIRHYAVTKLTISYIQYVIWQLVYFCAYFKSTEYQFSVMLNAYKLELSH